MNLNELLNVNHECEFDAEDKCIVYLERMRWPKGVHCPACGNQRISRIHSKGRSGKVRLLYQCLRKDCRYQFSTTTGTIFHDSHLPLSKWFKAITLVVSHGEPISINQLRLTLGIQYKSAQHVTLRIREALQNGTIEATPERRVDPGRMAGSSPIHENAAGGSNKLRKRSSVSRNHITINKSGETTVGNLFDAFRSIAQLTIKSPLYLADYIIKKV